MSLNTQANSTLVPLSALWDPGSQRWIFGNGASHSAVASSDGAIVAFVSEATNLVSQDTDADSDILLRRLGDNENQLLLGTAEGVHSHPMFVYEPGSSGTRTLLFSSTGRDLAGVAPTTDTRADLFIVNIGFDAEGRLETQGLVQLTTDAGATPLDFVHDQLKTSILYTTPLAAAASPWTHALHRLVDGTGELVLRTQHPISAALVQPDGSVVFSTRSAQVDIDGDGSSDVSGSDANNAEDLFVWRPASGSGAATVERLSVNAQGDAVTASTGTRLLGRVPDSETLLLASDISAGQSVATVPAGPLLVQLQRNGAGITWLAGARAKDADAGRHGQAVVVPDGSVHFKAGAADALLSTDGAAPVGGNTDPHLLGLMLDAHQLGVLASDVIGSALGVLFQTVSAEQLDFDVATFGANAHSQIVLAGYGQAFVSAPAIVDYATGSALNPLDAMGQPADVLIDITTDRVIEYELGGTVVRYSGELSTRLGRAPIGFDEDALFVLPHFAQVVADFGDDVFIAGHAAGYYQPVAIPGLGELALPVDAIVGSVAGNGGVDSWLLKGDRYLEATLQPLSVDQLVYAPGATEATVTVGSFSVLNWSQMDISKVVGSAGADVLEILPRHSQLASSQVTDLRTIAFTGFGGADTRDLVRLDNWVGSITAVPSIALQVRSGTAADGSAGVHVIGGDKNDLLVAGPGADSFNGGLGINTVDYRQSPHAVNVNLGALVFNGGYAAGDFLRSVAVLHGSDGKETDLLTGGTGNEEIYGEGGDDLLFDSAGDDLLDGGDGEDRLEAGAGTDRLVGGDGIDTVKVAARSADFVLMPILVAGHAFDYVLIDARAGAPLGTDFIAGVELFEFSDGTFTAAELILRPPSGVAIDIAASTLVLDEGQPGGSTTPAFELVLRRTSDFYSPLNVTVRLSPDTAAGAHSMDSADIGLAIGPDITRSFTPGSDVLRIPIPVRPDRLEEPLETLLASIVAVSHGNIGTSSQTLLTLRDDDARVVSIDPASSIVTAIEGGASSGSAWTLVLNRTGDTSAETIVNWLLEADPTQGVRALGAGDVGLPLGAGTSRFAPGESSIVLSLPVRGDAYHEGTETARFTLVNASQGAVAPAPTLLTVLDDDSFAVSLTAPASVREGELFDLRTFTNEEPGAPRLSFDYTLSFGPNFAVPFTGVSIPEVGAGFSHSYADGSPGAGTTIERISVTAVVPGSPVPSVASVNVNVRDVAPTMAVSGASSALAGLPWTLNLGAYVDVPGDPLLALAVDWGDGRGPVSIAATAPQLVSIRYATPGAKQVRVYASNDDGQFQVGSLTVAVNSEPVPQLASGGPGTEGSVQTLAISRPVHVQDLTQLNYTIEWGDNHIERYSGTQLAALPTPWTPVHRYADDLPGGMPYTARVDLDIGPQRLTATTPMLVSNVAPTATVDLPATVRLGEQALLTVSHYVDPGYDQPVHLLVEVDGVPTVLPWPAGMSSGSAATITLPLSFSTLGTHVVQARIVDEDGSFALAARAIDATVAVAPPPAGGTVGSWAAAWGNPFLALTHTADVTAATPTWSPVTLAAHSATVLSGGDLFQGRIGVSGQTLLSSSVRQEIDGREALRVTLDEPALRAEVMLERLFPDEAADGNFAESARMQLYLNGVFVGEQLVAGNRSDGQRALVIDPGHAFDTIVFSAGAYDAAGIFIPGAGVNALGNARMPTATASSSGLGSEYLLAGLELFFGSAAAVSLVGLEGQPAP